LEEAKKMSTGALDARRMRAAKNQSLLREVNERIEELAAGQSSSMFEALRLARTIDLACECMDETCTERVTLTVADYEAIRSNSNSFLVLPGHEVPDVEEVTRTEENYLVVSKLGVGARVAEKLDPRTRKDKR
jgi:ABC-type phosphate transport system ATPase subunit